MIDRQPNLLWRPYPDHSMFRPVPKMEVAAGLEPAKTGFADQRLDHFGIATRKLLYPIYTQTCTQIDPITPIYPSSPLCNLLKPHGRLIIRRFCRPMPYHLATAPSSVARKYKFPQKRKTHLPGLPVVGCDFSGLKTISRASTFPRRKTPMRNSYSNKGARSSVKV